MKLIDDFRIRLFGIAFIFVLRFAFMSSDMLEGLQAFSLGQLIENILGTLLMSLLVWEGNRVVVLHVNRRYPLAAAWGRRFTIELGYMIGVNIVLYAFILGIHFVLEPGDRPPFIYLWLGLLNWLLFAILVVAFYELLFYIDAWRKATQEAESLKKLNVTIQLESLKNQVKPHFLFNSLNTLTGLVEQDAPRAVRFIAELSKVYRYLLQSNEKEVIGLQQELDFTEAYFFLLQTRFGNALSMDVQVPEHMRQQYGIPPLTLQMLVENAVKHNQVSAAKPLQVRIWNEGDQWLLVQNNIQRKRHPNASTGMGLANIATKYQLLNQPQVMVQNDEQHFTIKVPLIKQTAV